MVEQPGEKEVFFFGNRLASSTLLRVLAGLMRTWWNS